MFNAPNNIFGNWNKTCFIAKKTSVQKDEYGNEVVVYSTPKKYIFNYQPITDKTEILAYQQQYGEVKISLIKAFIDLKYNGEINEFDLAYLYDATPNNELINGDNANYVVRTVTPQNTRIMIYFEEKTK